MTDLPDTIAAVRERGLGPVELTAACLERARATAALGAFALLDEEGARARRQTLDVDDVLDADRDAVQRPVRPRGVRESPGLRAGALLVEQRERAERRCRARPLQARRRQLDGSEPALAHPGDGVRQVRHSRRAIRCTVARDSRSRPSRTP